MYVSGAGVHREHETGQGAPAQGLCQQDKATRGGKQEPQTGSR